MRPTITGSRRLANNEEVLTRGGYLDVQAITPKVAGRGGADRGFIAGRSGSGKTFLARRLLSTYGPGEAVPAPYRAHLVLIDPNHNFQWTGSHRIVNQPGDVKLDKQNPVVLYRPGADADSAEAWNELWRRLFEDRRAVMTYCDETYAMEPLFRVTKALGGRNFLNAYLTQGRARGKAALFAAQRPVNIPQNIRGQAEWFYQFDLPIEDDRKTMAGTMGRYSDEGLDLVDRRSLNRYEFFHLNPNLRDPVRMRVIE